MEKSYLDIAKKVGIPGWDSTDPKIDKLELVKDWFERKTSGKWILILDNADDVDMLYGRDSGSIPLADYFPCAPNGAILLTTRNKKVGTRFQPSMMKLIHLQPLSVTESVRLLQARIGTGVDEELYANLATALENVPLALIQAAAFISEQSCEVSDYLQLYSQSDATKIQLLNDDFDDEIRDRDTDTKNPIAATFMISFEQIKRFDAYAAKILSYMSMLDPKAIPKSLLPYNGDAMGFRKALGTLEAYSLITKSSQEIQDDDFYDLHRLVRLAMHNWLNMNNELHLATSEAYLVMGERYPVSTFENREACRTCFPHAMVLLSIDRMIDPGMCQPETHMAQAELSYKVSRYLLQKGDYRLGESMVQSSLVIKEKWLGEEEVETLHAMLLRSLHLEGLGKTKEALKLGADATAAAEDARART
jgi:hypothetical protein